MFAVGAKGCMGQNGQCPTQAVYFYPSCRHKPTFNACPRCFRQHQVSNPLNCGCAHQYEKRKPKNKKKIRTLFTCSRDERLRHILSERQRRADIWNDIQVLRSLIPDLEAMDKRVSQQIILEKATHYCQSLSAGEEQQLAEIDALQKRKKELWKRMNFLQLKS